MIEFGWTGSYLNWALAALTYLLASAATAIFSRKAAPKGPEEMDGFFGLAWPVFWVILFFAIIIVGLGKLAKHVAGK